MVAAVKNDLPPFCGAVTMAERGFKLTIPTSAGDIVLALNVLGCPEGIEGYDLGEILSPAITEDLYDVMTGGRTSFPESVLEVVWQTTDPRTHL